MTVAGIAARSLRQRPLASALTAVGVALGVALVVLVFQIQTSSRRAFDAAGRGYDVIVSGLHTTPLTSLLSTVFHADKPADTFPVSVLDDLRKDPRVRHAVPFATGDVYHGSRVVGTTSEFFDTVEDAVGRPLKERIASGGRPISDGDENEAVVGSLAASRTGLALGSKFKVTHGLEEGGHEHDELWTVVGVLEPTGTPNDRAIFITIESFWDVKDHVGAGKALSAAIVRLTSPGLRYVFLADMRKRTDVQAAIPSQQISKLFDLVAAVDEWFRQVLALVVVVSGIVILVSLLNSIHGRRREIAILRSLGARPAHVFSVLVLEGAFLCLGGGALGVALGKGWIALVAPGLLENAGIRVAPEPSVVDAWALAGAVALGAVAAVLPAWRALRVPVAENLHPLD